MGGEAHHTLGPPKPFLTYRYKVHCAFIVSVSDTDPMPAPEAIFVCGVPVDGERVYCSRHAKLCLDGLSHAARGRRRALKDVVDAATKEERAAA